MLSRFGNRSLLHSCRVALTPQIGGATLTRAVSASRKPLTAAKPTGSALLRGVHTSTAGSNGVLHAHATAASSASASTPLGASATAGGSGSGNGSGSGSGSGVSGVGRVAVSNLNPAVVAAEYAVRGELVIRADAYRKQLAEGKGGLPFDEIISCNIGNPQELGQTPITFFRQVIALCQYPALLTSPAAAALFPADAIARANNYLKHIKGGTGAYSSSQGVTVVREEVAAFIRERDGTSASSVSAEDVFLTDGASSGVKMVINALVRGASDGIMIPIPQYPLYSATLTLNGGSAVGYFLDESKGWALQRAELEASLADAKARGVTVRGLVVINPGNPTGQVLSAENMKEIVSFCSANGIVLLADEVYQTNIYAATPFTSFKRVVSEAKSPADRATQLVSFHSVSKGFLGECGARGGYMELTNFDADVKLQILKMASISLCSNLTGQIVAGLMVNPPRPGQPSYALYAKERDTILSSLKRRAVSLAASLNAISGISCNVVEGAMYAFPSITLPVAFVKAAEAAGKAPDLFYCSKLLDATGIVVVPGSGFKQKPGTWHFRTTILPPEQMMVKVVAKFKTFHESILKQYGGLPTAKAKL